MQASLHKANEDVDGVRVSRSAYEGQERRKKVSLDTFVVNVAQRAARLSRRSKLDAGAP